MASIQQPRDHQSEMVRSRSNENLIKMNQDSTSSTISPNSIHHTSCPSAGQEKDPQVLSTSAPSKSDSLCAEQSNKINGKDKRRPSLHLTIPKTLFSSKTQTELRQDAGTSVDKNDNPSVDQQRRNSLRGTIGTKLSYLTRRLSTQSIPSKTSPLRSSSISQAAPAPAYKHTEIERPPEWPDKTEIDYIRRKNIAEAKRGAVYEEDGFEKETGEQSAATTTKTTTTGSLSPHTQSAQSAQSAQSLPLCSADGPPAQVHHWRAKSAPQHVQTLSKKPLDQPTRGRSLKAIRKSYLRQSPNDWSEYDVPEAEYFLLSSQGETLISALNEIVQHEKCGEMDGLCDHRYKSREKSRKVIEENDQAVKGYWFNTMEDALAAFHAELADQ